MKSRSNPGVIPARCHRLAAGPGTWKELLGEWTTRWDTSSSTRSACSSDGRAVVGAAALTGPTGAPAPGWLTGRAARRSWWSAPFPSSRSHARDHRVRPALPRSRHAHRVGRLTWGSRRSSSPRRGCCSDSSPGDSLLVNRGAVRLPGPASTPTTRRAAHLSPRRGRLRGLRHRQGHRPAHLQQARLAPVQHNTSSARAVLREQRRKTNHSLRDSCRSSGPSRPWWPGWGPWSTAAHHLQRDRRGALVGGMLFTGYVLADYIPGVDRHLERSSWSLIFLSHPPRQSSLAPRAAPGRRRRVAPRSARVLIAWGGRRLRGSRDLRRSLPSVRLFVNHDSGDRTKRSRRIPATTVACCLLLIRVIVVLIPRIVVNEHSIGRKIRGYPRDPRNRRPPQASGRAIVVHPERE